MLGGVVLQAFIVTASACSAPTVSTENPRGACAHLSSILRRCSPHLRLCHLHAFALCKFCAPRVVCAACLRAMAKVSDHAALHPRNPNELPPPRLSVADESSRRWRSSSCRASSRSFWSPPDVPLAASVVFAFAGSGVLVGTIALYNLWRNRTPIWPLPSARAAAR